MTGQTVFDLIREPKTNLVVHGWKTGKIPPAAFPINRPRSVPTGGDWQWRLIEFDALGYHCRVLIRLNEPKARYSACLMVDSGKSVRVLCHHELHIGDKGWHCHLATGRIDQVLEGVLRDVSCYRAFEMQPSAAPSTRFTVDEDNAVTKAAVRYRFEATGRLM